MLSTSLSKDLYKGYLRPEASDVQVLRVARLGAIVGGLLGIVLALLLESVISSLTISDVGADDAVEAGADAAAAGTENDRVPSVAAANRMVFKRIITGLPTSVPVRVTSRRQRTYGRTRGNAKLPLGVIRAFFPAIQPFTGL